MSEVTNLRRIVPEVRRTRRFYSRLLTAWSLGSMVVGFPAWLIWRESVFWGPFWMQCWVWGAIDLVFALLGLRQARAAERTAVADLSAAAAEAERADALKLLRALEFSHRLNWIWLATAAGLLIWAALAGSAGLAGHGTGVLIQGGYLFIQDRRFDSRLRSALAS